MNFELRALSINDGRDTYEMLQKLPADENGFINSAHGMTEEQYRQWLSKSAQAARQEGLVEGWKVPQSTYWLYADGVVVGMGRVRHFLTEALRQSGGHIGYAVHPDWRGRGCGKALLRLLIPECAKLGIERALLTVREDNIPSLATALACGGEVEKTENGRHHIWIQISR